MCLRPEHSTEFIYSLGTRLWDSLVADEDMKKPNKRTKHKVRKIRTKEILVCPVFT